jgi:hypothetical protein
MARLVPARPKDGEVFSRSVVELLGRSHGIDDDFVVFHGRPGLSGLFVIHPDRIPCLLLTLNGGIRFDPDVEAHVHASTGEDLDQVLRLARSAWIEATGISQFRTAFVVPHESDPFRPDVVPLRGLVPGLTGGLTAGVGGGEATVKEILQRLSPGASTYVRGSVTDAQTKWRADQIGQETPVPPPVQVTVSLAAEVTSITLLQGGGDAAVDGQVPVAGPVAAGSAVATSTTVPESVGKVISAPSIVIPDENMSPGMIRFAELSIEHAVGGREIFVCGVGVTPFEVASPAFLLPALVICAAEAWTPVVISKGGKGGFLTALRNDRDALLGYRVASLTPAAPLLMFIPIVHLLRTLIKVRGEGHHGEIDLDPMVAQFGRWLAKNKLDTSAISDVDVRVATSV